MKSLIIKTLCFFILSDFFLLGITSLPSDSKQISSTNSSNSSSGHSIHLIKGPAFYYARAYIGHSPNYGGLEDLLWHGDAVLLSLYSSMSMLPGNCSEFWDLVGAFELYDCSNPSSTEETVSYPYFEATGITATSKIFWTPNLNTSIKAVLPSSCALAPRTQFGSSCAALIALGTAGQSQDNLFSFFSIYLNPDPFASSLLFYFDSTKAQSTTANLTLTSDENWHVNSVTSIQVGNHSIDGLNNSLIFDLNFEPIILPTNIYKPLISFLGNWLGCGLYELSDSEDFDFTELPLTICSFMSATIYTLPNIILNVGNQNISIPPEIYVAEMNPIHKFVTLNLVAVGASFLSQFNLTAEYQDYIILGSSFMTFYYTVFEAQNGTNKISLYLANHNTVQVNTTLDQNSDNVDQKGNTPSYIIVIIALLSVILVTLCFGVGFCLCKRRPKIRDYSESPLLGSTCEV